MSPRLELTLRRVGGIVLVIVGVIFLAGPLVFTLWLAHMKTAGIAPKMLSGLAYQGTLGLFILIMGLYFLTRRPKKGPENHG
jgi:hypothetical protein